MRFLLIRFFVSPEFRRSVAAAAVVTLLVACSPQYNWRELTLADGHVRAAFPARVQSESRMVRLGDVATQFTMTVASVDEATFAVGHARMPAEVARDPDQRNKLARVLLGSAYRNLGAAVPADLDPGAQVVVRGEGARQGTWSLVKVWATADGLVQATVMGRDDNLPMAIAQEFIDQLVVSP